MKTLRVDIQGLTGIELENYQPHANKADSLTAICLHPTLVKHSPYLSIPAEQIDSDGTTLPGEVVRDTIRFDVSNYNLAFSFNPAPANRLTLPQDVISEMGGVKLGPVATYVPDMATLTAFSKLHADFKWPCPSTKVISALRLETGSVRARVGFFWTFWQGHAEPEQAPWKLIMRTADVVVCQMTVPDVVQITATPRTAGAAKYVAFADVPALRVAYDHHCMGLDDCESTIATQLPAFYDMLHRHYRRPLGRRSDVSETGYCPPTLFWD